MSQPIRTTEHPLRGANLRNYIKALAVEKFTNDIAMPLLRGGTLPNGQKISEDKVLPSVSLSIRDLWEGYVGNVHETIRTGRMENEIGRHGFTEVTKQIIYRDMIDAYNSPAFISNELMEVTPSNSKVEQIPGFFSGMGQSEEDIQPGEPYPHASFGEKTVTTEAKKYGRIIEVAEEIILEDKTGYLLDAARDIGEGVGKDKEVICLKGMLDGSTDTAVYRPGGSTTALYTTEHSNLLTGNELEDWEDIDAAITHHAQNITDDRELGTKLPIPWMPQQIVMFCSI